MCAQKHTHILKIVIKTKKNRKENIGFGSFAAQIVLLDETAGACTGVGWGKKLKNPARCFFIFKDTLFLVCRPRRFVGVKDRRRRRKKGTTTAEEEEEQVEP